MKNQITKKEKYTRYKIGHNNKSNFKINTSIKPNKGIIEYCNVYDESIYFYNFYYDLDSKIKYYNKKFILSWKNNSFNFYKFVNNKIVNCSNKISFTNYKKTEIKRINKILQNCNIPINNKLNLDANLRLLSYPCINEILKQNPNINLYIPQSRIFRKARDFDHLLNLVFNNINKNILNLVDEEIKKGDILFFLCKCYILKPFTNINILEEYRKIIPFGKLSDIRRKYFIEQCNK